MGSHGVTCHPTQMNAPRLTPVRKAGTLSTLKGSKLSWLRWLVTYRKTVTHPTINRDRRRVTCWSRLTRYRQAKPLFPVFHAHVQYYRHVQSYCRGKPTDTAVYPKSALPHSSPVSISELLCIINVSRGNIDSLQQSRNLNVFITVHFIVKICSVG